MLSRPVRRVRPDQAFASTQITQWPATVPVVAQLLREGLELPPGALFFVGENASGKSTLIEVLAHALGLNAQGGSQGSQLQARRSEPEDLALVVERGPGAPRWGYVFRNETLHGLYTYLEDHQDPFGRPETAYHELSHGEAFLKILAAKAARPGVFLLDEPEAGLSYKGTLRLLAHLHRAIDDGSQFIIATHSPIVAALSGATILEIGDWGMRPVDWDTLELTSSWRRFLADPESILRHLR